MRGGRGASAAVEWRDVAGRGTHERHTRGWRATDAETGEVGADRWAPATVPSGGDLNTFQIQTNSNYFQTFQTLTDPKMTFSSPKN
jgi:hypothetical protein